MTLRNLRSYHSKKENDVQIVKINNNEYNKKKNENENDNLYIKEENKEKEKEKEKEKGISTKNRKRMKKENEKYIEAIKKQKIEIDSENFSKETPPIVIQIRQKLQQEVIPSKKKLLMSYFKTGPGEYAEGDQFFGIPVPGVRSTLKYFSDLSFEGLFWLITSTYHEERMLATLYMTELAKKLAREENKKELNQSKKLPHPILDLINMELEKNKCHTIPELIYHFAHKEGSIPGERKGWDTIGYISTTKRQKEKFQRLGESRPVFLDQDTIKPEKTKLTSSFYQYRSSLGFTDPIILQKQILFEFYVECMPWIDNWDLVDLTSRDIVGGFLKELPEEQIKSILYHWITYKLNDQVAGYATLHKRIRKEEEKNSLLEISMEDLSLTTIWTKRVAIICTFYFINQSDFRYTIYLLESLLNFSNQEIHGPIKPEPIRNKERFHDLIEKASGWMLREIGKRDASVTGKKEPERKKIRKEKKKIKKKEEKNSNFDLYGNQQYTLIHFLNKYAWKMPRTMLRYSIEKLPTKEKKIYMNVTEPLE